MCIPLALATDFFANYFSQLLPLDALHPWMFWICIIVLLYYCIELYVASTPTVYNEYWLFPFSSPPCLLVLLSFCIVDLYCIVFNCVIAYTPQSTVSTGFTLLLTHMSAYVFVFLLQEGRSICVLTLCLITCIIVYYYLHHCVLLLAYCHWHWRLLLVICLLPQLRAVAPAPTLINIF